MRDLMKALLVETYLEAALNAMAEVEMMFDPAVSQMGNLLLARTIYTQHASLARSPEALVNLKILLKEILEDVKVAVDNVQEKDLIMNRQKDLFDEIKNEMGLSPDDDGFDDELADRLRERFKVKETEAKEIEIKGVFNLFNSKAKFDEE